MCNLLRKSNNLYAIMVADFGIGLEIIVKLIGCRLQRMGSKYFSCF
jgi:hypothetical protein